MNLYDAVGNCRGRLKTKENRAARLLDMWGDLHDKMVNMIVRGKGTSDTARHAYAVLLMMETAIRVGNEGSAEGYVCDLRKVDKDGNVIWQHELYGQVISTYGLTTLRHQHVFKKKDELHIQFLGKKAEAQELSTKHPILVAYKPQGNPDSLFLDISYSSLRKFCDRYVGRNFVPKDIRTARVNLLFIEHWKELEKSFQAASRKSDKKRIVGECIEWVANRVGHTKNVCRKSYLSSQLLEYIWGM